MTTALNYSSGDQAEELYWRTVMTMLGNSYHHVSDWQDTTWKLKRLLRNIGEQGIGYELVMSSGTLKQFSEVILRLEAGGRECLGFFRSGIRFDLAGTDLEQLAWFRRRVFRGAPPVPDPPPPDDSMISMNYAYHSPSGARQFRREIPAPKWADIQENYPPGIASFLEREIITQAPGGLVGNIGVLFGEPGTGKTTFLRALGQAWKKTASFTYVTDTDEFFRNTEYMLNILMNGSRKSHVIICEDAEEFLVTGAKRDVGQALSRVLNLGDGMLGQGLDVHFIFTTNSGERELLPAVIRPGRCFARLEFPKFSPSQAADWLASRGITRDITEPLSLAELYEITRRPHAAQ